MKNKPLKTFIYFYGIWGCIYLLCRCLAYIYMTGNTQVLLEESGERVKLVQEREIYDLYLQWLTLGQWQATGAAFGHTFSMERWTSAVLAVQNRQQVQMACSSPPSCGNLWNHHREDWRSCRVCSYSSCTTKIALLQGKGRRAVAKTSLCTRELH